MRRGRASCYDTAPIAFNEKKRVKIQLDTITLMTILKLLNLKYLLEILGEENLKDNTCFEYKDEGLVDYINKEIGQLDLHSNILKFFKR